MDSLFDDVQDSIEKRTHGVLGSSRLCGLEGRASCLGAAAELLLALVTEETSSPVSAVLLVLVSASNQRVRQLP